MAFGSIGQKTAKWSIYLPLSPKNERILIHPEVRRSPFAAGGYGGKYFASAPVHRLRNTPSEVRSFCRFSNHQCENETPCDPENGIEPNNDRLENPSAVQTISKNDDRSNCFQYPVRPSVRKNHEPHSDESSSSNYQGKD